MPITESISLGLSTHIQSNNIALMRQYFQDIGDPTVKYDKLITQSKISILGDFPRKQAKFPVICVGLPDGNLMARTIGQEMYQDLRDEKTGLIVGYRLGGSFPNVVFPVSIGSESTGERRKLIDYITTLYRIVGKPYLSSRGIHLVGLAKGPGREERYLSDYIYYDTLNVTVNTEWVKEVKGIDLIEQVEFDAKAIALETAQ